MRELSLPDPPLSARLSEPEADARAPKHLDSKLA